MANSSAWLERLEETLDQANFREEREIVIGRIVRQRHPPSDWHGIRRLWRSQRPMNNRWNGHRNRSSLPAGSMRLLEETSSYFTVRQSRSIDDVVNRASLAVHADRDVLTLQRAGELAAGEL